MKIEKRGKYPGVKVHLEPEECEEFMKLAADHKKAGGVTTSPNYYGLAVSLGKKITNLKGEYPTLLEARTEDEIREELEEEKEAATLKLAAINKGKDWKEVKVK